MNFIQLLCGRPRSIAIAALATLALALAPAGAANPTSVTVAASFQSELGCANDWDPACATTHLAYESGDDVWQGTFTIPAGSWEYKAALNDSWTESYGLHAAADGANIPITLASSTAVKFYYDDKTHWITDQRTSVIAVAPGSFQSELGCSSDWDPTCLRSWLEDPDGDGIYTFTTTSIPAGNYEAKVAINEDWAENYGQNGVASGANIPFTVPSNALVLFRYNSTSHVLTIISDAAQDGAGSFDYTGDPVANGSTGNMLLFTFTLGSSELFNNGALKVTLPAGWSPPSATATDAGYTTSGCGTVSGSGQTLTISGISMGAGSCDVTYGDRTGGGPGATAATTPGPSSFATQTKSTSGGTFTSIGSSPDVQVLAPDGSGTMATPTVAIQPGSQHNTIMFTYTAATGGIFDGTVILTVPPDWSPPSDTPGQPGYVDATGVPGFTFTYGRRIIADLLVMDAGDTFTFTYGSRSGGGPGAVAPTTPGRQSWPTREQSACSCDSRLLELASFPAIRVLPPDGSGAMAVKPSAVSASSRDTLAFVYAPAPGGTENGVLTIDVPSSWSAPSTTPTADGYVTSDVGTVAVSGRKITVSALSLAGTNVTIKYGSTASGGPGALAPSSPGAQTWVAKQKSTAGGTFANLAQAPQTTVYAPDGSGTMTTPTSTVPHGASGKTVSFTYTVAPGGMANGHVKLRVPNGWSAPSTTGADPGFISASAGAVSLDGRTIIVSGLTLAAGQTVTITYGAKGSGGPAANAPGSAVGAQTWEARERSTPPGSSRQLGSSPVIAVT